MELRSKAGDWYQVRLDMEVPGALLFRDSQGRVYAIESDVLRQVSGVQHESRMRVSMRVSLLACIM